MLASPSGTDDTRCQEDDDGNDGHPFNNEVRTKQYTKNWSSRLLTRMKSVVLSPFLEVELDMSTRLAQYKSVLAACLVDRNVQSHQFSMDLMRMDKEWSVRVRKLACHGTSRQLVERHRFLHHLLVQELRLAIEVEACVSQILDIRCCECDAFMELATSCPPSDVEGIVDLSFFAPPSQLITTHPEYIRLHSRQQCLVSVIAQARDALQRAVPSPPPTLSSSPEPLAMTSSTAADLLCILRAMVLAYPRDDLHPHDDFPLLSFPTPTAHASFSVHLESFRRAVSTTHSTTGRLVRRWHVKLRQDIERIVVQEEEEEVSSNHSTARDAAFLDASCPLISPARIIVHCPTTRANPFAAVAIDTARLPSPHVLAAFESFLARRIYHDLMLHQHQQHMKIDHEVMTSSSTLAAMLRVGVHHVVFANLAPLTCAYEDNAVFKHLGHLKGRPKASTMPLLLRPSASLSGNYDMEWTPALLPQTMHALTCLCAETTPLGILSILMIAIRCLHEEVAPYIPSMNADVLIPLLLQVFWMQLDVLPSIYRRLHAAATFSQAYVHDGAEVGMLMTSCRCEYQCVLPCMLVVVYYLTCMQAAASHIYASTVESCQHCIAEHDVSIQWRDLGAPDIDSVGPNNDKEAIAELSAWLKHHSVADSTISIVSKESWML
ncbi:hypothetical protein DYB26_008701 [Aphanomyces astaci]|uniref:Uncharacterized protein n=1 Tax=Aphanomyces astaci TaxID=112090 RepID=A0A397EIA8_APHAT|nr:hypothetical protein DYB38_008131 [Aphanomyces astaci]RHZ30717.1 hypothetical protein DYB26_008701 [Aphanomyces astaci]